MFSLISHLYPVDDYDFTDEFTVKIFPLRGY